jgi:hypothetical protein
MVVRIGKLVRKNGINLQPRLLDKMIAKKWASRHTSYISNIVKYTVKAPLRNGPNAGKQPVYFNYPRRLERKSKFLQTALCWCVYLLVVLLRLTCA